MKNAPKSKTTIIGARGTSKKCQFADIFWIELTYLWWFEIQSFTVKIDTGYATYDMEMPWRRVSDFSQVWKGRYMKMVEVYDLERWPYLLWLVAQPKKGSQETGCFFISLSTLSAPNLCCRRQRRSRLSPCWIIKIYVEWDVIDGYEHWSLNRSQPLLLKARSATNIRTNANEMRWMDRPPLQWFICSNYPLEIVSNRMFKSI